MDDKRLNFGKPIHSTRRFALLPFYKSELKSGPVCCPGTVPFRWEKSPGMPKTDASDSRESSFEDCITEEAASTTTSTCLEDDGDCEAEAYSDSPEELSRTESFFFNCSLGGISGLGEGADVRPFGMLSTDLMVQDLMMGRFLPAAQAMAAETPTHANKKQPVKVEETMCISRARNAPKQLRYEECKPDLSPNYAPELYRVETDDDDEDGDCSLSEDHSLNGCGFLTRFCVKAPFRIMNGVPATNLKAGEAIGKLHITSSNKIFNTWLKQKHASHTRTSNPKIYNHGRSSLKASASPKPEHAPLPTKIHAQRYRPQFSHDEGCTNASESDTKRKNSLPREKPSTSFRDLLARENAEWSSRSKVSAVKKNLYVDFRRMDESQADVSESKTEYRNAAVVHPESSIRNMDNLRRKQGNIDSNRFSKNETSERGGDPLTTRFHKVTHENSHGHYSNLPLSPPLPNSPSESWLFRTLPFTPSPKRRPSLGAHKFRPSN